MARKLILLNYNSTGAHGFAGMFALAGGYKATIAARLNGADLEVRGFPLGDGKLYEWGLVPRRLPADEVPQGVYTYKKDPAFVAATGGYGTIPALLAEDGSIGCCESNAIARAVARSGDRVQLYGNTPWETAQIDMFLDKCLVFERDRGDWIDATLFGESAGFVLSDDQIAKHRAGARKWLSSIDSHLDRREFLVGASISLADVVLACQMLVPWCCLLDDELKAAFPNLGAHLSKLWEMPEFKADLGGAVTALTEQFQSRRGQSESRA